MFPQSLFPFVQQKMFGRISGKPLMTTPNCFPRDIQPDILGIISQGQLITVTATQFENGLDPVRPYKVIQHFSFELRKSAIRARA